MRLIKTMLSFALAAMLANPAMAQETQAPFKDVAECVSTCEKALDAAQLALASAESERRELESANSDLQAHLRELNATNVQLQEENHKWYRDPLTVMPIAFGLGLIAGVLGAHK